MFSFIKKWFKGHTKEEQIIDKMDIDSIHKDLFLDIFNQNVSVENIDGFLEGLQTILIYYRHKLSILDEQSVELPMSITTDVNRQTLGIHNYRNRHVEENDWTRIPTLTAFFNRIAQLPMDDNTQNNVISTKVMKLYANWREYTNNSILEVIMFLDASTKLVRKLMTLPDVNKRHFFFNVYSPLFVVIANIVDFSSAVVEEVNLDSPIKI
jgi:hypothetical protein|nr:MAG TPA: hypothetical protein [Caudoviricetes sp.]